MEQVNECVIEYSLNVKAKKSNVVCTNGEAKRRRCKI